MQTRVHRNPLAASRSACCLVCVGLVYVGCSLDPVSEPPAQDRGGTPGVGLGGGPPLGAGGDMSSASGGAATGSGGVSATGGTTTGDTGATGTSTGPLCYSPSQNLAIVDQVGATGCPCDPSTVAAVCVSGVGLVCQNSIWTKVQGDPCLPTVPTSYSPEACIAAGGTPVASTGVPLNAATDCSSGVALGVIDPVASGWIEGGLCCSAAATPKACGARAGDTCLGNEYCAYQEGQQCGWGDAEATCKARPVSCVELYAPVCGCDQKSYDNSCLAAVAGTGIFAAGKCTF